MAKIRAFLADDEKSARDVLENLLARYCPEVELCGCFSNVIDVVTAIKSDKPDLVFLDIEMPNYAGFEIVKFFEVMDFQIIFVTAYDKYALRAFEVAAVDYLLKPIDIERLKLAVSRVKNLSDLKQSSERISLLGQSLQSGEIKNIMVSDKGSQHVVAVNSIIAIEAQESYCFIHTENKKYTVSKNLRHFENILAGNVDFFRVHKSWIISKKHIQTYSKTDLTIQLQNGLNAKLSKYRKADFEDALIS